MAASDPEMLRARAAQYREKATALRGRAKFTADPTILQQFLTTAADYEAMASQLAELAIQLETLA
jgi:hypothetical protein